MEEKNKKKLRFFLTNLNLPSKNNFLKAICNDYFNKLIFIYIYTRLKNDEKYTKNKRILKSKSNIKQN